MRTRLELLRLADSHIREGRENLKRVYELRFNREQFVLNLYTEKTDAAVTQFRKNVRALILLARYNVPAPRLHYVSEKDLVFIVPHVGEQLDHALRHIPAADGSRAIQQAGKIILALARIHAKRSPFMIPRPMERFEASWKRKIFAHANERTRLNVQAVLRAMRKVAGALQKRRFLYGLGRIDGDLINFAYDARRKEVSTFDFDGLRNTYDCYYQIGYLWVSIERLHQKKHQPRKVATLRKALEDVTPWDEPYARERFALGAASAMSIAVFHRPRETNMIQKRTKEMHDILFRFRSPS